MRGSSTEEPTTWFTAHSGVALFCAGALMVVAAVAIPRQSPAIATVLILIGAAVMLIGGLLPRLAGTIKITPGSVELALAERLEATRVEAMRRDPDRVDEAVSRAFERMRTELLSNPPGSATTAVPNAGRRPGPASVSATAPAGSASGSQREADAGTLPDYRPEPATMSAPRANRTLRALVLVGAFVAGIFGVQVLVGAPPPGAVPGPPGPEPGSGTLGFIEAAALVVAFIAIAAGVLLALRTVRRRNSVNVATSPPLSVSPSEFARQVVDDLAFEARRGAADGAG